MAFIVGRKDFHFIWRMFPIGGENMQVELIKNGTIYALQSNINGKLEELKDMEIISVSVSFGVDSDGDDLFVGTILYK